MGNPQFIIVLDGSDYKPMYEHMLMELSDREDVTFVTDKKKNEKIKRILLKRKSLALLKGKLDFIAYEENNLFEAIKYYCEKKRDVYVIFFNASLHYNVYMPETLLRYKKQWQGLRYVLFYLDIMGCGVSKNADKLRKRNIFDVVYSIDEKDAKESGAIFWRTFYSKDKKYENIEVIWDMYFCGNSKGRTPILSAIAAQTEQRQMQAKMDVICYEDTETLRKYESINVREVGNCLSYPEVLHRELQSSCILEIVQEGQTALTLRPYEAVVYNRKLLTNNKSIREFPYWNPEYMQYFEKVEDIDWDWVLEKKEVDYQYDGRYSPVHLLNDIENRLQGEKA